MRTTLVALVSLAGLLALAIPAVATPPCTCDPGPWNCLFTDGSAPTPGCPTVTLPPVPPAPTPGVPDLHGLDPRNWPCTCDPGPVLQ